MNTFLPYFLSSELALARENTVTMRMPQQKHRQAQSKHMHAALLIHSLSTLVSKILVQMQTKRESISKFIQDRISGSQNKCINLDRIKSFFIFCYL